MDNVCHTLAGAVLGEAGLKHRTALGMATLLVASNVPDVDAAVFATDTLAMSFRRGWTHGVLAMAVLPVALAATMFALGRLTGRRRQGSAAQGPQPAPLRFSGLLALACIGTWLHIFMDWLNSYGIRLLKPFSDRWFYGDALYIVDPILYAVFGVALVLARRAAKRGDATPQRFARRGLAIAAVYAALMLASNWWARAEVRAGLTRAGRGDARFMVTPVFGNPFRREVIVDVGDRYEKGDLWFDPLPHFRPAGYGVSVNRDHPAVRRALATPRVQAFLLWSRFPFFVVEETAERTRVFVNDYRYSGAGGRDGWATQVIDAADGKRHGVDGERRQEGAPDPP